ncbi:PLP-dependent aminotransferase family protein [Caulobacter sp. RHG1]|uniref:aminotransferase-like domain-containing protein n=1 Tax=Caulobacter sp. (strain RHG1) TaxID=2545762 RepID=UPI0015571054|nr:PLP-dependent aminotransferase family protein [Caulobacter sp. RHG1]NQE63287.1 DNA-binding transcriptional regulator, MocR family / aminotransferase domain [Caulobacter sp. RHG1]
MGRTASRTGEVMDAIRDRIAGRTLTQGDRLPSIRAMAGMLGVSPSTVVEAYDRLVAQGAILSRPGSGFYVSAGVATPQVNDLSPQADRDIDPLWVSRQSLDAALETLKPGCGWLPPEWMPNAILRRAIRGLARADDAVLADYGNSRGLRDLRQLLARRCTGEGLDVAPEQVLLTTSGTQAIDLICRFLLKPGDTVLVDDPCYFNFRALLRAHQVRTVGVPYTPTGPDLARFGEALSQERPRLYITNSAIHNPTGATLSAQTAHKLLTLASAHGLIIVEDDIFAEFEPELSPRLAILDGLVNVIRIGSFSKTLSASVRCGYIAARPDWIEAMVDLQVATHFGGASPVAGRLVFDSLMDSGYRRHVEALRRRLSDARRDAGARLADLGVQTWVTPRGGFYLWTQLPDDRDASDVAKRALAEGMILAPGNVFSVAQKASSFMRFNVGQMRDPRTYAVLARALTAR